MKNQNEINAQFPFPMPFNTFDSLAVEQFREHLKDREIWINGLINERLIDTLYMNLVSLNVRDPRLPINVMINSNGGNFYEAFVATDVMSTMQAPITTIGLANICSGGFILFMGGQLRMIHENTNIMIHSAGLTMTDKVPMLDEHLNYLKVGMEKLELFLEKQTGVEFKFWKDIIDSGKERYFTADEAIRLRIAHKIIGSQRLIVRKPYSWDLSSIT